MRHAPYRRSTDLTIHDIIRITGWILLVFFMFTAVMPAYGDLSEGDTAPWPRTEVDDQGKTVTLDTIPERIISLAPSNTELLYALGLGDRIRGVTEYCNYPEDALKKDKIGGFSTVSLEKVIALKPDFVVASEGNNPETIERIRSFGIPVYYVDAKSLADIYAVLEKLGDLTGTTAKAKSLVAGLKSREDAVKARSEKDTEKPVMAHVIWYDPIYVSGSGTFQDELIRTAGGVNAFSDKPDHHIVNVEEFIDKNPDILLINSGSGMDDTKEELLHYFQTEPRLSSLKAIKENNTILVDSNIADRSGPRLWDMLEEIADAISQS